jgi:hypothetical protein
MYACPPREKTALTPYDIFLGLLSRHAVLKDGREERANLVR